MNRALGPHIRELVSSPALLEILLDQGVCNIEQLRSKLQRRAWRWRIEKIGGDEEIRRLDGLMSSARDGHSAAVACGSNAPPRQIPSVCGIAGPCEESPVIATRRREMKEARILLKERLLELKSSNALPSKVDLVPYGCPVGQQGALGACVGWGSGANRGMLARQEVSPLYNYGLAKYLDNRPDLEGSWQHFSFEGMGRYGTLPESEYPYNDSGQWPPVEEYFERAAAMKIDGFADVLLDPEDMEYFPLLMKAILAGELSQDLGPQYLSVSLAIYESWADMDEFGVGSKPDPSELLMGGHALAVVGYIDGDDPDGLYDTDFFILKNSWGREWASKNPLGYPGYGLLPVQYFMEDWLVWEAIVCIAEPSPAGQRNLLDRLRVLWHFDGISQN